MNRKTLNMIDFLITCLILFVAITISNGSFAIRINKISENLDKALSDVMNENQPNFTEINKSDNISKIMFHPRGMAGLYNITNLFMDIILPKNINYTKGIIKITKHPKYPKYQQIQHSNNINNIHERIELGSIQEEWKILLINYWALLLLIIIIVLIVILMPFCGLCFCCCRCCGKCGARTRPCDKKHDLCKKIILATILIGLGTLLLFGVVCAFVSNEQMQDGIDNFTKNLRKNINDTKTFIDTTNNQIDTLLVVNYDEFEQVLFKTINQSTNIVYDELANYSNATAMTELANIVKRLPKIRQGFDTLKYSTNSLRVYASQLNDAVRKVKKDLLQTLKKCNLKQCREMNKNISNLQTNIHFNAYIDRYFPKLPDISEQITALDNLDHKQFESAVTDGKKNLEIVRNKIDEKVYITLKQAKNQINKVGQQIKQTGKNLTKTIKNYEQQIDDLTKPNIKMTDDYIKNYSRYRYYSGLIISCSLLLICLCIAFGLICGICGKRPDIYGDDDCCNKGAGSQFLICSVMFMFFIGTIIAIIVLISIISGLTIQRIICDPLKNPNESKVLKIIDEEVNLKNFGLDFKIYEAIVDCNANKTIYQVFHLKNKFDLDKLDNSLETYNISDILKKLDVSSVKFKDFKILSNENNETLQKLANSSFALINFDHFEEILKENFTTFNLSHLSNELGELIRNIDNKDGPKDILTELSLAKMNLETYQEKIVEPMIENATAVVELASSLEYDLKLGYGSFQEAINHMLIELKLAEDTLRQNGTKRLKKIAENFTEGLINQIRNYLNRVVNKTTYEVGKCGTVSVILNNTLTSTCDKILMPWNGFWFSLLWSLILFIPTIIVSVKLSKLYQKYNPYREHLFEAEYLYDAYADRDNIPLNSRNSKNKKKNKKYKHYEDRPVPTPSSGEMGARGDCASGSHQDARYADMTPKHWEEYRTGGPPQYQRAPTEYERPPPYYFPGASETH